MDSVQVYGVFFTPEEQKERESWHDETWIEREIPTELEEKISKYIDKQVKKFEKKCGCALCKLRK